MMVTYQVNPFAKPYETLLFNISLNGIAIRFNSLADVLKTVQS